MADGAAADFPPKPTMRQQLSARRWPRPPGPGSDMTWRSQAGQDEWVHSIIGDTSYDGNARFFVDVGAHDGVVHSNTYALEQRGWAGICIEANPDVARTLHANRLCGVMCAAIGDRGGTTRRFAGGRIVGECRIEVPCHTLNQILENRRSRVVDYLSIDVEGHELEVLDGMDFDRFHVQTLTIEHNLYRNGPALKDAIHARLAAHGFKRVVENVVAPGYGPYEDWYVNKARPPLPQEGRAPPIA